MPGFEPRSSGDGGKPSANLGTTAARGKIFIVSSSITYFEL